MGHQTAQSLNNIIPILIDSRRGYEMAADLCEDDYVHKAKFLKKIAERAAMTAEFQAHVRLQGEEPKEKGGPLGKLHRMLTGMSKNFGSEEKTALKAIDDGEAFLQQACETELEKDDVDSVGRNLLKQALSSAKSGESYAEAEAEAEAES